MCDYPSSTKHEPYVATRYAHRDSSRIVSARVCELSLRMGRMRTGRRRRAVPERLVEEEKALGATVSRARPGQRSESKALDVVSNFDHSVDSCFLVSARNVCFMQTDKAARSAGLGFGGPAIVGLFAR